MLKLKRAYDPAAAGDGRRVLVERLWPRGISKDNLKLDGWLKDVAPSTGLRQWFHHDPERWTEFQRRYRRELSAHPDVWKPLVAAATAGPVTLVYSSHDTEHNNAVALRAFLTPKIRRRTTSSTAGRRTSGTARARTRARS
ncbi:MAG TPA: DUF488 domain-containing protein [Vicinamibacterales bacterium]